MPCHPKVLLADAQLPFSVSNHPEENPGEVRPLRVSLMTEVVETYVNETDELVHVFVNGEEIVTTPSHPFYSPVKGWTDAVKLRAGDILVLVNGEYVVVEMIQHEILETPVKVYNFQVEDYHTYYVTDTGVLVHNACGEASSAKLRSNLINAGDVAPTIPHAAHHIVAGNAKGALGARSILESFTIGINDAVNGVFLPTVGGSNAALHTTLHTNAYYAKVERLLLNAHSRNEAIAILGFIKKSLLNNSFGG